MSTNIKSEIGFKDLQIKAQALLGRYHSAPARYGTAFHITPPFPDVRDLAVERKPLLGSFSVDALSLKEQEKIDQVVNNEDPYLLWYMTHLNSLPGRVIRVEDGQVMTIQSKGAELLFCFVGKGASLSLQQIITEEKLAVSRLFIWQEEKSEFTFWGVRSKNVFSQERVRVNLMGRGARANIRHLTFGSGRDQSDIEVQVYHQARETQSDMIVRSAAVEKNVSIYRGLIDIDEKAKGSNGYQQARALLLSSGAVVDNLPELAIRTNDVQCSHGVNTTHIDEAALFYMRARGISESEARRLTLTGFYHDMIDIPQELHAQLEGFI